MTLSACAVADGAAEGAGEVGVDAGDVGAGQVVDGDGVGAAEGVDVDVLDAGGVHGDGADVAEEPEPVAVGGQVEVLGAVGAVEEHRVGAVLALDGVAAVAGIPDEGVVAGAQQGEVVAAVAVDRVVTGTAEQRLRSGASEQGVVSISAVDPGGDGCVNAPLRSSIRTTSLPARAWTTILAISFRLKLKSAEPLSPTSTWRVPALWALRRSAIVSPACVPSIVSVRCLSFGCSKRACMLG